MAREPKWVRQSLERVLQYADSRGLDVEFGRGISSQFAHPHSIQVDSSKTLHDQLCVLLHELGHFLIWAQPGKGPTAYPRGWVAHGAARSGLARVDVVLEEVEAWNRGQALATRLGIKVDNERFARSRSRRLRSYFTWAAEKNPKKGIEQPTQSELG